MIGRSMTQAVLSFAFAAEACLGASQPAQAQTQTSLPDVKKLKLHTLVKEEFGSRKNIPVDDLFKTDRKYKPFNADQHMKLLNKYAQVGLPSLDIATNSLTGEKDTLYVGAAYWDCRSGYKAVFTYDKKNDVIDVHNGGMDPAQKNEWRSAAGAIFGLPLKSDKVAISYAEKGFIDMQKRFPQISKEKTSLRFMGYSCGGPSAILGAFGMALKGYHIDQVVLIDPYAAVYPIKQVGRLVKGRCNKRKLDDFIDQKFTTMTPIGGSFVDKIPPRGLLAVDFGRIEKVDAGPKGERHFISHYFGKYTARNTLP